MTLHHDARTYLPAGEPELRHLRRVIDDATLSRAELDLSTRGVRAQVPVDVQRILRQVIDAFESGEAVTVIPHTEQLSTEQAAAVLGVSRPTVVRLIENGRLRAVKVGTHRRVALADLTRFISDQRQAQEELLDALTADRNILDEEPLEDLLAEARSVRKEIAGQGRRSRHP